VDVPPAYLHGKRVKFLASSFRLSEWEEVQNNSAMSFMDLLVRRSNSYATRPHLRAEKLAIYRFLLLKYKTVVTSLVVSFVALPLESKERMPEDFFDFRACHSLGFQANIVCRRPRLFIPMKGSLCKTLRTG
jgi:hypothetical protein